jgi:hypothetical protein
MNGSEYKCTRILNLQGWTKTAVKTEYRFEKLRK